MNYKESKKILQAIKDAKNILITSHKDPDADSIGSILGLSDAIKSVNKNIRLVCKDEVPEYLSFLKGSQKIIKTDFSEFDFSKFNLVFALDSSRWSQVVGAEPEYDFSDSKVIVIDHHASNAGYGTINLVDKTSTSTCEIIYKLLQDLKLPITKDSAEAILTGMIGDTGSFRYPGLSAETFAIASDLIKKGAKRDKINFELYFNVEFNEIKYLSAILDKAVLDTKNKIIWSAISNEIYKKFDEPEGSNFAGVFFQTIKDTEIGVFMVEKEKDILDVSFRSRKSIDASKIAVELGGGGHKKAAGAKLQDVEFNMAVKKVLSTVKKYTKS